MKDVGSTRPSTSVRYDLEGIINLIESRGWAIILDVLTREGDVAVQRLTGNPTSSKEELDFNRACLRSINLMKNMPDMIRLQLENELALAVDSEPMKEELK